MTIQTHAFSPIATGTLAALGISIERQLDLTGAAQRNRAAHTDPYYAVSIRSADEIRWIAAQQSTGEFNLNLRGAIFRKADLRGADLASADLTGSRWEYTNAQEADLGCAQLMDAVIHHCTFIGARAVGTYFQRANLAQNNWQAANLACSNMQHATIGDDMRYTDLTGVIINHTTTLTNAWQYDQQTRLPAEPITISRVLRDQADPQCGWQRLVTVAALEQPSMDWRSWAQLVLDTMDVEALRWAITTLYPWFAVFMRTHLPLAEYVDLARLEARLQWHHYPL